MGENIPSLQLTLGVLFATDIAAAFVASPMAIPTAMMFVVSIDFVQKKD